MLVAKSNISMILTSTVALLLHICAGKPTNFIERNDIKISNDSSLRGKELVLIEGVASTAELPSPIFALNAEDYSGSGDWIDQISGITCTIGANTIFSSEEDGPAFFQFDYSQESLITCPYDISPSINSELTLEIVFKLDDDFNPDVTLGWIIGHDNGGYDRGFILSDNRFGGVGQGIGGTYTSGLSTPSNGEWHHAISTYAQNVDQSTFVCIDNECGIPTTASNNDGNSAFTIGGLSNFANHGIKGAVSSIRIYTRAFDKEMAADAYNAYTEETNPDEGCEDRLCQIGPLFCKIFCSSA